MGKNIFIMIIISLFLSLLIVGCSQNISKDNEKNKVGTIGTWKNIELTNVLSGEKFKLSDYKGQKVLLESFAVWCPTCTLQQQEIKKLHDNGYKVISISIDTDPNEDTEQIKEHLLTYGFDWPYAVAPVEFTKALIDDFGIGVVNAPSAPIVLICEDQSTRLMGRGLKKSEELKVEITKGC